MAVGDDALEAGMPLVPATGEEGRVRYGYREINRTRDFIAQVIRMIPSGTGGFREASRMYVGTTDPSPGKEGDIYFKVIT